MKDTERKLRELQAICKMLGVVELELHIYNRMPAYYPSIRVNILPKNKKETRSLRLFMESNEGRDIIHQLYNEKHIFIKRVIYLIDYFDNCSNRFKGLREFVITIDKTSGGIVF